MTEGDLPKTHEERRRLSAAGLCPRCGGSLIRRSRVLLLGSAFGIIVAGLAVAYGCPYRAIVYAMGFPLGIGGYLIAWATFGRGLWCRTCKDYPRVRRPKPQD